MILVEAITEMYTYRFLVFSSSAEGKDLVGEVIFPNQWLFASLYPPLIGALQ